MGFATAKIINSRVSTLRSVIALVGRPNVGKSTLFNCLTRSKDALVADYPGLTRDRQFGIGKLGKQSYVVVDTGGLTSTDKNAGIYALMKQQAQLAIEESDLVLFLVDAREGLTADDQAVAELLRSGNKPVYLVVNKIDGMDHIIASSEFYALGMGEPIGIAASHGRGVSQMINMVLEELAGDDVNNSLPEPENDDSIRVAVIGRPNVGKSTLINRLIGEQRVLTYDAPGTTRDSIYIPFERHNHKFTLIDTAGIRRRGKTHEAVEKFSVIKALQAIADANVVIQVIDAHEGMTEQDMSLLGQVLEQGRALIFAINKWDGLSAEHREQVKQTLSRKLDFINFAEIHFISALHGSGVGLLLEDVIEAYESAMSDLVTSKLTKILEEAVTMHQPPLSRGRRIKLRYAHQGGKNPPRIVIHGNQTEKLADAYKRYLSNHFIKRLRLKGTPVKIELKTTDNPYKDRKNKLTQRQLKRKKRLMKHVKKS